MHPLTHTLTFWKAWPLGLRHAVAVALKAQLVSLLTGTALLLVTNQKGFLALWLTGSFVGALALVGLADVCARHLSTIQTNSKEVIVKVLTSILARWALLALLLTGLSGGSLWKTVIALLACFGYNWGVLLLWVYQAGYRWVRSTRHPVPVTE